MTTLTDTQVITASGGLVELGASTYTGGTLNISSSSAASPTNVISDTTVVCDGSPVEIEFFAPQVTTGASGNTYIALWKDGAEFVRYWGVMSSSSTTAPMRLMYRDTPTAGSHTYSVKGFYATAAGQVIANTGGTAQAPASLRVSKIVQATQWPAVTTGTIICTSSTRPASPFAGQKIWETDTSKEYTYTGSAWIQTGPAPRRLAYVTRGSAGTDNYTVSDTTSPGTTDIFSSDASWTADGSTYWIETYFSIVEAGSSAGSEVIIHLVDGSGANIHRLGVVGQASVRHPLFLRVPYTPSAGSAAVNIRAYRSVSNGIMYAGSPGPVAYLAVFGPDLT